MARSAIEIVAEVLRSQSRSRKLTKEQVAALRDEIGAEDLTLGSEEHVYPNPDVPETLVEGRIDPVVETAKPKLLEFLQAHPSEVFYATQLEVIFEGPYFHWVTGRALDELVQEGKLKSESIPLWPPAPEPNLRFFWLPRLRYWTREAEKRRKVVQKFSRATFGHALGDQGEMLFDAALTKFGFQNVGQEVKAWKGRAWTESGHNLDRVYERDGVEYGAEIKNALPYITPVEFQAKVAMAISMRLRPLLICRALPKTYINTVRVLGGFSLVFGYQMYPFGHETLAQEVSQSLGLPIGRRIEDGTPQRFLKWHLETLERRRLGAQGT